MDDANCSTQISYAGCRQNVELVRHLPVADNTHGTRAKRVAWSFIKIVRGWWVGALS